MLQWVTFCMALFSTVLWLGVITVLCKIRGQLKASRAMLGAIGAMSPLVTTSATGLAYSAPYVAPDSIINEGGTGDLDPPAPEA
jgi:hypothetical protein